MTSSLPPPSDRWDIDRLNVERAEAVAAFGFTERQARFLVEVMIHSGVFVERQYCTFSGIVHGQKTHDFLRRPVERGFARPIQVGALHRGRLFHVSHKPLYAAIGEADNRHRKTIRSAGWSSDSWCSTPSLPTAASRGSAPSPTSGGTSCGSSATP